jgi:hypothetical protein
MIVCRNIPQDIRHHRHELWVCEGRDGVRGKRVGRVDCCERLADRGWEIIRSISSRDGSYELAGKHAQYANHRRRRFRRHVSAPDNYRQPHKGVVVVVVHLALQIAPDHVI